MSRALWAPGQENWKRHLFSRVFLNFLELFGTRTFWIFFGLLARKIGKGTCPKCPKRVPKVPVTPPPERGLIPPY